VLTESSVTPWEGGDQPTGIAVGLSGAVSTREYSVECLQVIGELQTMLEDSLTCFDVLLWLLVEASEETHKIMKNTSCPHCGIRR
jgi:hypothetical protein